MAQESGLAKRGLVVFGVLLLMVVTLGYMIFKRPATPELKELPHAEPHVTALVLPATAFPGTLAWGAIYDLRDRLPSPPGWQIRYTATQVLANRGSDKLPLDTLREMLDEPQQERNHRLPMRDRVVSNQTDVQQILLVGLRSFQEWLKHPEAVKSVGADNPRLRAAYAAAERLTEHPNQVVRNEALKVRLVVNPK